MLFIVKFNEINESQLTIFSIFISRLFNLSISFSNFITSYKLEKNKNNKLLDQIILNNLINLKIIAFCSFHYIQALFPFIPYYITKRKHNTFKAQSIYLFP